MRTAKEWEHYIDIAAHLGAEGELERKIKMVQDDARENLRLACEAALRHINCSMLHSNPELSSEALEQAEKQLKEALGV